MKSSPVVVCVAATVIASSFLFAAAHPPAKTCSTQAGSDTFGLPTVDGTFTAMSGAGVTWDTKFTDASPTFFGTSGSTITLRVPMTYSDANEATFGFFAIVDYGTVTFNNASLTNPCEDACSRVVCQNSPGDFDITVVNPDLQTCNQTRLVVGYGAQGANELQFATLNLCDGASTVVMAAPSVSPPTPVTDPTGPSDCPVLNETYDTDVSWRSLVPCRSDLDCACVFDNTDWTCGFFGTPFLVVTEEVGVPDTCYKGWVAYLFFGLACAVVLALIIGLICACVKCGKNGGGSSPPSARATTKANVYELTSPRRSPPAFGVPDTWGTNEVEIGASPMSQRYKQSVRANGERQTMGM